MKLETLYSVDDIVWVMKNNLAQKSRITRINIDVTPIIGTGKYKINKDYYLYNSSTDTYQEANLFSSKEELIKSL